MWRDTPRCIELWPVDLDQLEAGLSRVNFSGPFEHHDVIVEGQPRLDKRSRRRVKGVDHPGLRPLAIGGLASQSQGRDQRCVSGRKDYPKLAKASIDTGLSWGPRKPGMARPAVQLTPRLPLNAGGNRQLCASTEMTHT